MTYEQKARALAAASALARRQILTHISACPDCEGIETHAPNCPALLDKTPTPGAATLEEPLTLEQVKALHVARVLREKNGNRTAAARALAIDRRTLYHMIERYGIEVPSCNAK